MDTRFCKQDHEPMLLKQEFDFEDALMYQEEEDYGAFVKVENENEECVKGMIVPENRPQTSPQPRQEGRNHATVTIERQPEYDRVFLQASRPSSERAAATIDPFHPQNYCAVCDDTFTSQARFRLHIRRVHSLKVKYFKHPHETIDPNHPKNYCGKCGKSYSYNYFRMHLKHMHGIAVETLKPGRPIRKPCTPRKLNRYYCEMCKRTYRKDYFSRHLQTIHSLQGEILERVISNARALGSEEHENKIGRPRFTTCCTQCNRFFRSRLGFRQHLKTQLHNATAIKYPNAKIDIFHPNHYCAQCDKQYAAAPGFYCHLRNHHMSTLCNTRSTAKIFSMRDAPEFYCPKCDRYYNENIFKQHFANHRTSKPVLVNPNAEIDFNSPDFYCSKCETRNANPRSFKMHIMRVHGMTSEWYQAAKQKKILHPDAEIDFFNTDRHHCAKCDRPFRNRAMLWEHAAIIHAAYPPSMLEKLPKHGLCNLRNGKKLIPILK